MRQELVIREAAEDDLDALLALYQHLNPGDPAPDPETARRLLAHLSLYAGSAVLLGFCKDDLAASCTLIVIPNLTRGGAPYALIENVVTDARYRKRGFGKAILTEALAPAVTAG